MNRPSYVFRVIVKTVIYREETTDPFTTLVTSAFQYDENGNKTKELNGEGFYAATGSTDTDKINNGDGTT